MGVLLLVDAVAGIDPLEADLAHLRRTLPGIDSVGIKIEEVRDRHRQRDGRDGRELVEQSVRVSFVGSSVVCDRFRVHRVVDLDEFVILERKSPLGKSSWSLLVICWFSAGRGGAEDGFLEQERSGCGARRQPAWMVRGRLDDCGAGDLKRFRGLQDIRAPGRIDAVGGVGNGRARIPG